MAHIDWTAVLAARGIPDPPGRQETLEALIEATRLNEEAAEQEALEKARRAQEKLAASAHRPRRRLVPRVKP